MKHAVSVVIYTHNEADLIAQATKTLLEGVNTEIELVIVDDGSTDKTAAVVGMLSLHERYRGLVRVISHIEEEGKLASWADGVKAARSDYVLCMSSTDLLNVEELQKLYEKASACAADIAIPTLRFSENPHAEPEEIGKIIAPPKDINPGISIVQSIFIGDTFEPHLGGWLFQKELLLHSFAQIEREELSKIDESGIVFIAATRAEKLLSAPDVSPLITTTIFSIHARKIEIFEDLCSQNETLAVCKAYLDTNRAQESEMQAYNGLSLMLCTRVCRLFPARVPAEFWQKGAELLLSCWGPVAVASSYAHLPQASLSEVAIALASGLSRAEARKIERIILLVQDQDQLLDALSYSDKLVKNKKAVSFIVEDDVTVSPGMPIAAKLDSQIFSQKRGAALIRAFERQHADALIVFGHERRFAYDMLLARVQGLQVGLITEDARFTPRRFLELLPQVAFSNAVVSSNDVEAELWGLLDVEISSLQNLVNKLGQKARGSIHLASRELIFTLSRLAFGYLQKAALLKDAKKNDAGAIGQLQKDITTLLAKNKELESELFQTERERDEYLGFYEGRLSKRVVAKRIQELHYPKD